MEDALNRYLSATADHLSPETAVLLSDEFTEEDGRILIEAEVLGRPVNLELKIEGNLGNRSIQKLGSIKALFPAIQRFEFEINLDELRAVTNQDMELQFTLHPLWQVPDDPLHLPK